MLLNVGFTGLDAAGNMAEGQSVVGSIAKAAAGFAWQDIQMGMLGGPAATALMLADLGKMGVDMALANGREKAGKVKNATTGFGTMGNGSFADNNYSATMRQRALQDIGGTQGATRNILGSEARRRSGYINY